MQYENCIVFGLLLWIWKDSVNRNSYKLVLCAFVLKMLQICNMCLICDRRNLLQLLVTVAQIHKSTPASLCLYIRGKYQ